MPHLRMFLDGQQMDEVFIPDALLLGVSLTRLVEEEKQKLIKKHATRLRNADQSPSFFVEMVPSKVYAFRPLQFKIENSGNGN